MIVPKTHTKQLKMAKVVASRFALLKVEGDDDDKGKKAAPKSNSAQASKKKNKKKKGGQDDEEVNRNKSKQC